MATRWRRFPFFERTNVSLPNNIISQIIPSDKVVAETWNEWDEAIVDKFSITTAALAETIFISSPFASNNIYIIQNEQYERTIKIPGVEDCQISDLVSVPDPRNNNNIYLGIVTASVVYLALYNSTNNSNVDNDSLKVIFSLKLDECQCMSMSLTAGLWLYVAVGTAKGSIQVYSLNTNKTLVHHRHAENVYDLVNNVAMKDLSQYLVADIKPPGDSVIHSVKSLYFSCSSSKSTNSSTEYEGHTLTQQTHKKTAPPTHLFVCFDDASSKCSSSSSGSKQGIKTFEYGVSCYSIDPTLSTGLGGRIDLSNDCIMSGKTTSLNPVEQTLVVAKDDGLYIYTPEEQRGALAVEMKKLCVSVVGKSFNAGETAIDNERTSKIQDSKNPHCMKSSYIALATADESNKSNRNAVDIYDTTNKLVVAHILLSPMHRALASCGSESSCAIITSGGSVVILKEKSTEKKVELLLQKHLYSTAISVAYSDILYPYKKISNLYRLYAEYLYEQNQFDESIQQFIFTIGSLAPSVVVTKFLEANKIPYLVKYLEALRSNNSSSQVHNDLLRACYLKLNDIDAAEKLSKAESSLTTVTKLLNQSGATSALAALCSYYAEDAANALSILGPTLVKTHPRETAGVVLTLCDGTYSPNNLASFLGVDGNKNDASNNIRHQTCERFNVDMFVTCFLEHPKLLRLILSHCKRNNCELSSELRRSHLELTLEEWKIARERRDSKTMKLRSQEIMTALTDSYAEEIGLFEALVMVQLANFSEGEILLYGKLQMAPLLIEKYAADGGDRARRQMIVMAQNDPELLAEVLGHFVSFASNQLSTKQEKPQVDLRQGCDDDNSCFSSDSETDDIYDDIRETLELCQSYQGILSPVRIIRILSSEGTGQFTSNDMSISSRNVNATVPLSVVSDYISNLLDGSFLDISRLKQEVEEYSKACDDMQKEIDALLHLDSNSSSNMVDYMYTSLVGSIQKSKNNLNNAQTTTTNCISEEFWRDIEHSEDRFSTIARYFGKDIID